MVHDVASDAVSVQLTVRPARLRRPLLEGQRVDADRVVRRCPPTSAEVVERESGSLWLVRYDRQTSDTCTMTNQACPNCDAHYWTTTIAYATGERGEGEPLRESPTPSCGLRAPLCAGGGRHTPRHRRRPVIRKRGAPRSRRGTRDQPRGTRPAEPLSAGSRRGCGATGQPHQRSDEQRQIHPCCSCLSWEHHTSPGWVISRRR
jgi:hypothetical protein